MGEEGRRMVKCPLGYGRFRRLECADVDCEKYDGCVEELGLRQVDLRGDLWPDPGIPIAYESEEALFAEIVQFIHDHIDFTVEDVEYVLASWVMMTYRMDDFSTTPYLYFIGPPYSGKTRCLEVLWQLCHQPVFSATISPAALYRIIEMYHPTLLLDEAEAYTHGERGVETQLILNNGYRRGVKAVRCEIWNGKEVKVKSFDVFGPKALAGTGELLPTLSSRCLVIHMERKTRRIRLFIDEEWAKRIRGMLTYYQFHRSISEGMPVPEEKLEALGGTRLAELTLPLLKVAPTEEVQSRIYSYAINLSNRRKDEEAASDEAVVVKAIADLYFNSNGQPQPQSTIPVKAIAEKVMEFEEAYSDRDRASWSRKIGWITSRLGFRKSRPRGLSVIRVNEPLLKRLMSRYVPQDLNPCSPEMEPISEPSPSIPGETQQTPQTPFDSTSMENGLKSRDLGEITLNQNVFKGHEKLPSGVCEVNGVFHAYREGQTHPNVNGDSRWSLKPRQLTRGINGEETHPKPDTNPSLPLTAALKAPNLGSTSRLPSSFNQEESLPSPSIKTAGKAEAKAKAETNGSLIQCSRRDFQVTGLKGLKAQGTVLSHLEALNWPVGSVKSNWEILNFFDNKPHSTTMPTEKRHQEATEFMDILLENGVVELDHIEPDGEDTIPFYRRRK